MTPKLKIIVQSAVVVFLIFISSFITIKSREWFPEKSEIRLVFEGSRFAGVPGIKPLKDRTTYYFKNCDFTGRQFGEFITNKEVDDAIAQLEKEKP